MTDERPAPSAPATPVQLRAALDALPAYTPGRAASHRADVTAYKISSNENPYPPLPSVLDVVRDAAGSMNRYPDMAVSGLTTALAARLAVPGGAFVLVAFHPHFMIASGIPTHFRSSSGEEVAITTHVHLLSEQVAAGLGAGLRLVEMREAVIDERWIELKPRWEPFRGHPISAALVWRSDDD